MKPLWLGWIFCCDDQREGNVYQWNGYAFPFMVNACARYMKFFGYPDPGEGSKIDVGKESRNGKWGADACLGQIAPDVNDETSKLIYENACYGCIASVAFFFPLIAYCELQDALNVGKVIWYNFYEY